MWLRVAAGRLRGWTGRFRGCSASSLSSLRDRSSFLRPISQQFNHVFGRRNLSLLSDDTARNEQMLSSLTEYKAGQQHENIGEYNKACHEYTRVHDIISSAMGKSSPIAFQVALKCCDMLFLQGKFDQVSKFLNPNDYSSPQHKVHSQLLLSKACLMNGAVLDSIQYANNCLRLCEGSNEIDVGVLGNVYSIYGLSSLYQLNFDDAQQYLQLACRWNTTSLYQLQSMTNMGAYYWLRLDGGLSCHRTLQEFIHNKLQGKSVNKPEGRTNIVTTNDAASVTANTPATGIAMSAEVRANLNEAISYWAEALNELTNPKHNPSTACGPVGVDTLPRTVSIGSTGSNEKVQNSILDEKLKDERFTHAYAILLSNLADGYLLSGKEQLSVDTVSSALKAIEKYQHLPHFRGIYGFILGKLALIYMFNYQAVTAEGLLRTALDALGSPSCANPVDVHERSKISLFYGSLLLKWEKRESLGMKYIQESENSKGKTPYQSGIDLCRMIQIQQ